MHSGRFMIYPFRGCCIVLQSSWHVLLSLQKLDVGPIYPSHDFIYVRSSVACTCSHLLVQMPSRLSKRFSGSIGARRVPLGGLDAPLPAFSWFFCYPLRTSMSRPRVPHLVRPLIRYAALLVVCLHQVQMTCIRAS